MRGGRVGMTVAAYFCLHTASKAALALASGRILSRVREHDAVLVAECTFAFNLVLAFNEAR